MFSILTPTPQTLYLSGLNVSSLDPRLSESAWILILPENFATQLWGALPQAAQVAGISPGLGGPACLRRERWLKKTQNSVSAAGTRSQTGRQASATAVPRRLASDSLKYMLGSVWHFKRKSVKLC